MNWKKNAFSYFLWLLYTVTAGSCLFCVIAFWGEGAGYSLPIRCLICCLCLFGAGAIVLLLRFFNRAFPLLRKNERLFYYIEGAVVIALLGAGLFLCIRSFPQSYTGEGYYELAKVTKEGGVIQVVHGAVYLYLRLLHVVCLLFGNKIAVCVWLQTVLYLAAAVVLYGAVRRLAGSIPAIVLLIFMMFSPFLTAESRTLSPDILYLLLYAAALHLVAVCLKRGRCGYVWYVLTGIVIGFLVYLDIAGVTLFSIMASVFWVSWEGKGVKNKRGTAFGICLGSGGIGFLVCIALDALLSGKEFVSVLNAWVSLYMPKQPTFPTVPYEGNAYWDIAVLLFLMCVGIFSFWCKRKTEKIGIWVLASGILIGGQCFRMTTNEMPGFYLLYLFWAVLAGVGIAEAFERRSVVVTGDEPSRVQAPAFGEYRKNSRSRRQRKTDDSVSEREMTVPESGEKDKMEEENEKKFQYIENPLPLPKRHIAKKMDYKLEVVDLERLDYDYDTDDTDDYDI